MEPAVQVPMMKARAQSHCSLPPVTSSRSARAAGEWPTAAGELSVSIEARDYPYSDSKSITLSPEPDSPRSVTFKSVPVGITVTISATFTGTFDGITETKTYTDRVTKTITGGRNVIMLNPTESGSATVEIPAFTVEIATATGVRTSGLPDTWEVTGRPQFEFKAVPSDRENPFPEVTTFAWSPDTSTTDTCELTFRDLGINLTTLPYRASAAVPVSVTCTASCGAASRPAAATIKLYKPARISFSGGTYSLSGCSISASSSDDIAPDAMLSIVVACETTSDAKYTATKTCTWSEIDSDGFTMSVGDRFNLTGSPGSFIEIGGNWIINVYSLHVESVTLDDGTEIDIGGTTGFQRE